MTIPNPLTIDELLFILLLSSPIIYWGYRHGLDAVMIAVIGTLAGMVLADALASAVSAGVNTFWRIASAMVSVGFGPEFFTRIREGPGLFETPPQIQFLGTVIFLAITYVAFRLAFKRAGGRSNILEGVFGAIGGAVTGYIIVTFLIPRHFTLPQRVEIVETQLPSFALDANVVVLIVLIVVVFAVQSSKKKKK